MRNVRQAQEEGFPFHEACNDVPAFDAHCDGPWFRTFFSASGDFAAGPTWRVRGTRVEDPRHGGGPGRESPDTPTGAAGV
ncbi:hypothetical protein FRAAL4740 [Frankia alni ACN14a]|uniref:Uncharacterized protein n=1 Tax=Frankia alni (strain DSM 45986 / CECT 9034 / ACN14a) TaxID=326424 RepID=Q0RGK6_FRAAA|nr:hypothetical protein FRAAL4740 [Frankia alni ACN14a]